MGYRVDYQPVRKVRAMERRFVRLPSLIGVCFLCFLLLVKLFWPGGEAVLRDMLLPGDPAVTTAAFETMTRELQSGAGVGDSLRRFCLVILEGAGFGVD